MPVWKNIVEPRLVQRFFISMIRHAIEASGTGYASSVASSEVQLVSPGSHVDIKQNVVYVA
jgi:hypothetical protein